MSFSWYSDRDELDDFYRRPGTTLGPDNLGGPVWNWWLAPFWWDRSLCGYRRNGTGLGVLSMDQMPRLR